MTTEVLIYIILAGIAALILALFQYAYKSKRTRLKAILAMVRFFTYFFVLLLLINPKFDKTTVYSEKPNLIVAIDNSESIKHLGQDENVSNFIESIRSNSELSDNFNLDFFQFGTDVGPLDSLSFSDTQSDISKVFSSLDQVYKNSKSPLLLITDGNQTFGNDYEFVSRGFKQAIYPIILGDTITYSDLKIQQLNVNKYAYLKNKFPVELFLTYSGSSNVNTEIIITSGNATVFKQPLNFSKSENSKTLQLNLPATRVGVSSFRATIKPLATEKNTVNNSKPFAVEVIDQKTNVAIVSSITHPDIGALKNSIESNEQRSVAILKPSEFVRTKDNYQLAILYQPNNTFREVFEALDATKDNRFVITGTQTQWSFLNRMQSKYSQEITSQSEEFQADVNSNFGAFIINDLDFGSFPPLSSEFGEFTVNSPYQTLLFKSISGFTITEPLLLTIEENNQREAVLLGEHIWKWRAQSYLNSRSFQEFDNFLGKLVQYLSTNQQRRRLTVNYESFYNGNSDIIISAQFFNKNYEFDNKANLEIILKNEQTETSTTLPFVIKQNNYQVNLSGLIPGNYAFTVRANKGEATRSGSLTILDYNVEQQFLNANVDKLERIAEASNGASYFIGNTNDIAQNLIQDSRYATVQKSTKKIVPLIDFKYLLLLLALSLALEWFIRKYNGLI
ncbi:MAG: VWA domain-containing protein [Bacteroidia bacterium]|nr:VWA domain-containing protein [Bacteroidia bacterium]